MMRPPIVAVINHRICESKRNLDLFLFAFSDNRISEDWFLAEGERFLSTEPFNPLNSIGTDFLGGDRAFGENSENSEHSDAATPNSPISNP